MIRVRRERQRKLKIKILLNDYMYLKFKLVQKKMKPKKIEPFIHLLVFAPVHNKLFINIA